MTRRTKKTLIILGCAALALAFVYRSAVNGHLGPNDYYERQRLGP